MRAARIDNNQNQIVSMLRDYPHITVSITSACGNGFPDIVVGYEGLSFLFEIKDTGKRRKLTDAEILFRRGWTGHYDVIESVDEILELIGYDNALNEEELLIMDEFKNEILYTKSEKRMFE